jgi:hypothetical protein
MLQQILRVAVEVIAGVAANDLGCGFERTDRLVGMRDEVDRRMNRVLRHARPTAPTRESSILPWLPKEKSPSP